MKNLKMALMGLAALSSVGGAFAFSSAPKKDATTYYAVKQGDSFIWTANQRRDLTCSPTDTNAVCSITTENVPQDGVVPTNHQSPNKRILK